MSLLFLKYHSDSSRYRLEIVPNLRPNDIQMNIENSSDEVLIIPSHYSPLLFKAVKVH